MTGGHYSITEVVDEILSHDDKAAGLGINWQIFGSNGQEKADYSRPVLERFTRRAPKNCGELVNGKIVVWGNEYIKLIVNPRKVDFIDNPHFFHYFEGFFAVNTNAEPIGKNIWYQSPILTDKLVINHYTTKSLEEYLNKIPRSDPCFDRITVHKGKFEAINLYANKDFDDSILAYRDERLKIYQPPKPRSDNDLLKALKRNLPLNAPPDYYVGKMETFLTCREVASYLQTKLANNTIAKFYEELSLNAALKAFVTSPSIADRELFLRELPTLLRLPYAYLQLEHIKELFKDVPDFINGQGNIATQELEFINRPATLTLTKKF